MLRTGQVINNLYEVRRKIGEGAGGEVYLAKHLHLKKYVVIKRIKENFVGHINERHEADILKKLHHEYLPQVYDFIQMGTEVYTIIDYVEGDTMRDFIREKKFFTEAQIIRWTLELLDALKYLHSQNPPIIHSDIKPSNIMIRKDGTVCLIDFNISFGDDSEHDASGYSEGYASPEQVYRIQLYSSGGNYRDVHLDARSDIFSLGASIYNLMTGINPAWKLKYKQPLWSGPEKFPPYSEQFRQVITRSMRRNPKERYQSAEEMQNDILSLKIRDRDYRRLKRGQLIFNCVFSAVLATGIVMTYFGYQQMNVEEFEKKVADVRQETEERSDNYSEIREKSAEALNNPKYAAARSKEKESVADLYYIIGNTYFEQKDYENAAGCFADALKYSRENPDYFRDYAIALARDKKTEEAQNVVDHSGKEALKDENLAIVKGEIALANDDPDAAAEEFEKVIANAADPELLYRAYSDCAEAYEKADSVEKAIDVLKRGRKDGHLSEKYIRSILGQLGSICIGEINRIYNESGKSDETEDLVKEATDVYDALLKNGKDSSFTDYRNFAELLGKEEKYSDAQNLLLGAESRFGDDYRFWMEMANLELEKQSHVDESVRNYDETLNYYERAEKYYERMKNDGREDPDMTDLENTIKELKNKNWIS